MNASTLKLHVSIGGNAPNFFARRTMFFFGDTMKNYGVRPKPVIVAGVECWELYRRKPVRYGLSEPAYFDTVHFRQVFP
jgi:hypothetical protein